MERQIIRTIRSSCKKCYSCIRECPAKAILVENGQAMVLGERCITCGHCVKVCSQHAKQVLNQIDPVIDMIHSGERVIALVAPSFPAAFEEDFMKIPSVLRAIGFTDVVEAAFGADLLGESYKERITQQNGLPGITSACPAVVNMIRRYHSELIPNLIPLVSPMIAAGKYLKSEYGEATRVVFIGPCIAKKDEINWQGYENIIDAVLTFSELKELIAEKQLSLAEQVDSFFDPPYALPGKSYPLVGGLLRSIDCEQNFFDKKILTVQGKNMVGELLNEMEAGNINAEFIDVLFCEGCINGPAVASSFNNFTKREKVINYIEKSQGFVDKAHWRSSIFNSRYIDVAADFIAIPANRPMPGEEKIKEILKSINKYQPGDELNCGACGYTTCRDFAIILAKGLGEKEMCLPYLFEELKETYSNLHDTQQQLHFAEKLASIGQLAAGVAHEINNPLGIIMLYASLLEKTLSKDPGNNQLIQDIRLIIEEAVKCKSIVSNLLNFARQGKLQLRNFNLSELVRHCINTACSLNSLPNLLVLYPESEVDIQLKADEDQIEQVLRNIINNALEAMEKVTQPILSVTLRSIDKKVIIEISDTGCGIPAENAKQVFTPFFTTKKIGKGTGLGLAIVYGIIKMHRGDIFFKNSSAGGTVFTVSLPQE